MHALIRLEDEQMSCAIFVNFIPSATHRALRNGLDMAENVPDEKRTYVRVDSLLQARIKFIDSRAYEAAKILRSSQIQPQAPLHHTESFDEDISPAQLFQQIAAMLVRINAKIDRLIDLHEENKSDQTILENVESIDISGSGMSLIVSAPVEIGQLLQISMSTMGLPAGLFDLHGKVVRITPMDENEKESFRIGVEFIDISEEERDRLIEYSFSRQRKLIRQRKMEY